MRYATFLSTVEQVGGMTREQAERASEVTLRTLAERITGGEAADIARFLPEQLRPFLFPSREEAERFGLDEFYRRVADRAGIDRRTAAGPARAGVVALRLALAP